MLVLLPSDTDRSSFAKGFPSQCVHLVDNGIRVLEWLHDVNLTLTAQVQQSRPNLSLTVL